jgi:Ca2+/Na+ antiporter
MKEKAPYYHNMVTNETTAVCPAGFKTEYVGYYARVAEADQQHDHSHDHTRAAAPSHEAATEAGGTEGAKKKSKSLKDRVKEYGPAGVALYLVIHFTSASIIFVAMVFGVDVTALARKVGLDVHAEGTSWPALWVAAIVVNKLFVPIQAGLTLALAPKVTPVLRRVLARFGIGVKQPAAAAAVGTPVVKSPPSH